MLGQHKVGIVQSDVGHLQRGQHVFVTPSEIRGYEWPVRCRAYAKDKGRLLLEDEVTILSVNRR